MKKLCVFLFLAVRLSMAAISANTVWEVRSATGTDTNGGGYVPGAGVDMSQYDNKNAAGCTNCYSSTANLSTTDAVTNNSTTVTSATAGFTSALLNNLVYLSGTGTTAGWYQVVAVPSSTSITVDRATGSTGGTGVTLNIGGALRTLSAIINTSAPAIVAGNTVYCDGTFTELVGIGVTGTATAPILVKGYHTTRGSGQATINVANTRAYCVETSAGNMQYWNWENMVFSGGSSWTINVNNNTTKYWSFRNCRFTGGGSSATRAIYSSTSSAFTNGLFIFCEFDSYAMTADGLFTIYHSQNLDTCHFHDMSGNRFLISLSSGGGFNIRRCVFRNNNSGATNGIIKAASFSDVQVRESTFYGNGGAAVFADSASYRITVENSIFVNGGAKPVQGSGASLNGTILLNNRFYGNTGGNDCPSTYDWGNNLVLTAFPFVSASPLNLALNNTVGGGADGRGAAMGISFPGLSSTPAGALDIGAVQHVDPSGGGSGPTQSGYTYIGQNRAPNRELYPLIHPNRKEGTDWAIPTLLSTVIAGLAGLAARRG
jgi:hypothetical protein